ncbi:MAG: hypothetical protein AAB790_00425 [Patescibacteria group bacterium]
MFPAPFELDSTGTYLSATDPKAVLLQQQLEQFFGVRSAKVAVDPDLVAVEIVQDPANRQKAFTDHDALLFGRNYRPAHLLCDLVP